MCRTVRCRIVVVAAVLLWVAVGCQNSSKDPELSDTNSAGDAHADGSPVDAGDTRDVGEVGSAPPSDGGGDGADGADTSSPSDTGDRPDVPDASRDGGDVGAADAGDGGMDTADAPSFPGKARLIVRFDRPWVRSKVVEDSVGISCFPVDEKGRRQMTPGDISISIAGGKGAKNGKGRWEFQKAGVYKVSCSSASLGMSARRPLVVAHPGIDYRYAEASEVVGTVPEALRAAVEANADLNGKAFNEAVDRLETRAKAVPKLTGVDLLVDNPNGWPSVSKLKQAGLKSSADDQKWVSALDALIKAVDEERKALEALPETPGSADRMAVEAAITKTEAAFRRFQKISPSKVAVWKHRAKLGKLSARVIETTEVRAKQMTAMLRANPPSAPGPGSFSAIGSVAGIVISNAVSGYTYQGILLKAGKVIVANMISQAIKKLINSRIPANANAPELAYTQTGALSGVVQGGKAFGARGKFSGDADRTRIIFVPPTISNHLANVVDVVNSVRQAMQAQNVLHVVNEIQKSIRTLEKMGRGFAQNAGSFIVLKPRSAIGVGDNALLQFPTLPKGLNCSSPFNAPVAGTMIPIDMHAGAGKAVNVNVLGEPKSNCP